MQVHKILIHAGITVGVAFGITCSAARADAALSTPTISASASSSSRVELAWSDTNVHVTGFSIERSLKPSTGFKVIAKVNSGSVRSYLDGGLHAATTYYYRIRTINGSRLSRRSDVASTTTFPITTLPPLPTATTTPVPTSTPIRTATAVATVTALPTAVATVTALPTSTVTAVPTTTATRTPVPTATATRTAVPTATMTAVPTATATVTPIPTTTATTTATRTATAIPTVTATPVPTETRTATPVQTSTPVRTATAVVTVTAVPTPAPTATSGSGVASWARRVGGTGSDTTKAVAIDGRGDVVVAGSFTGTADFGGGALATAGSSDIVFAKYTSAGTHVWSKRMGAVALDQAFGVAIDRSANCDGEGGTDCVVVAGSFGGTVDFDPGPGTANLTTAGAADAFVAKYSSAGTYLWAKRFGGSNASYNDYLYGVAIDSRTNCDGQGGAGCILFIGSFYDRADFDGVTLAGPAGVMTPYVAKYAGDGTQVWAKTFANTNEGFGRAIAVSANGDVAITGSFKGSMNFGNGTKSSFGNDDVFVAVLRGADGSGIWSSRHGSGGQDVGYGITFDGDGNVAVTGSFSSTSGGISFGGTSWSANGTDIFLASMGPTGAHRWSRRCTGTYTMTRQGTSVATDDDGNVLLAGHFYGSLNCGTDTVTLTGAGYADVLTAKFGPSGASLWLDRFGRMGCADSGTGIAVDPSGDQVVATGVFQGSIDIDGQMLTSAGFDDAFVTRLLP